MAHGVCSSRWQILPLERRGWAVHLSFILRAHGLLGSLPSVVRWAEDRCGIPSVCFSIWVGLRIQVLGIRLGSLPGDQVGKDTKQRQSRVQSQR